MDLEMLRCYMVCAGTGWCDKAVKTAPVSIQQLREDHQRRRTRGFYVTPARASSRTGPLCVDLGDDRGICRGCLSLAGSVSGG